MRDRGGGCVVLFLLDTQEATGPSPVVPTKETLGNTLSCGLSGLSNSRKLGSRLPPELPHIGMVFRAS